MSFQLDKPPRDIILASASPRRRELLGMLGLDFRVIPAEVDETVHHELAPEKLVQSLASQKAIAVARENPETLVIGADTVVVLDDVILGKPSDPDEARDMLMRLSGRTHRVYTGIALVHHQSGRVDTASPATDVTFAPLTHDQIDRYVRTGEPMDKAGAYGIQGLGALLIQGINGCYFNVVGLPLFTLARMLESWGYEIP